MSEQSRAVALMLFYVGSMILFSGGALMILYIETARINIDQVRTEDIVLTMGVFWIVLTAIILPLGWVLLGTLFPEFRKQQKHKQ